MAERRHLRTDIEGLRAVAVVLVLLYHAGLAWVPGGFAGVDVFFVISGFLITSLIVRGVERHGQVRLANFWARRARRILPASSAVLAFSAVVTVLWLPVTSRREFGGDIMASAFYVVNWRLGLREADYMAENVGLSPVQHYWSLAVEEQFYLLWPLLIMAVVVAFRSRWRVALLAAISLSSVASFVYALKYADARPELAFYSSATRVWELGVGALLAICLPAAPRIPTLVRAFLGWVGLALIVVAALRFDGTTVWPGAATLVPVLGAAAVIVAGGEQGRVRFGADRILGLGPAVVIGGMSYSLYLWHWPFLVGARGIWGDLRVSESLLVVLASAVPAALSYHYLENPLRTSPRFAATRPGLAMGAIATTVSVVAGLAVIASFALVYTPPAPAAQAAPGARALTDPGQVGVNWSTAEKADSVSPSPLDALADIPAIYDTDCVVEQEADAFEACDFGDVDGSRTVVLIGDSKAVQWFSPVNAIAEREGWRLVVITKNVCEFADAPRLLENHHLNTTCQTWGRKALDTIEKIDPDLVLTVTHFNDALPPGGTDEGDYEDEAMVAGLATYWRQILDGGAVLVPLVDTPGPSVAVPECVQENPAQLTACGTPIDEAVEHSGAAAQLNAAQRVPGARVVDMTSAFCPDRRTCPAVIGDVLIYRNGTHVTDTYARSMTPALAAALADATDGLLGAG